MANTRFTRITDAEASRTAFSALVSYFRERAKLFEQYPVGWPSGSGKFDLFWLKELRLWGVLEPHPPSGESKGRFWLLFGNQPPDARMISIVVEMNPPHAGINRRVAGAFLNDSEGNLYLAHSGKIGGGRPGIGGNAFRDWISSNAEDLQLHQRDGLFVFGPISDVRWAEQLSKYVDAVSRFKDQVKSNSR